MPTYDYKCSKCNKIYEVFHKMSDTKIRYCPKCKNVLSKIITETQQPIYIGQDFTKSMKC